MKTKEVIKSKGLELFNLFGVRNITLRRIGEELDRSYGNITYHFPNKSRLVAALYADMVRELGAVAGSFDPTSPELFRQLLEAPIATFQVSLRYIFLFKDYVEIMRSFPEVASQVKQSNESRKQGFLMLLKVLITQGILRDDLTDEDLLYLMELSGAMRTQFMMNVETGETGGAEEREKEQTTDVDVESRFSDYTNRLLLPYLTPQGRDVFDSWLSEVRAT